MATFAKLTGIGANKDGAPVDTRGGKDFTLYVLVPGSWDRAGSVFVDASADSTNWTPLAGGTASPLSQAITATDDGKLFYVVKANEPHRYLRMRWNNTTPGTVGTLTAHLIIHDGAEGNWQVGGEA
jgi:hypothetical protein